MSERPSALGMEDEETNLTPLLDCIFILIFFFLVATTIKKDEPVIELNLPRAPIEADAPPSEFLRLHIAADGSVLVGEEATMIRQPGMEMQSLTDSLREVIEQQSGMPIALVADAAAPMQAFTDVTVALSDLGVQTTVVRTEPAPPGEAP